MQRVLSLGQASVGSGVGFATLNGVNSRETTPVQIAAQALNISPMPGPFGYQAALRQGESLHTAPRADAEMASVAALLALSPPPSGRSSQVQE